ncbi:MAG: hypothetical protein V3U76_14475 [Granulosicoccus sp.]
MASAPCSPALNVFKGDVIADCRQRHRHPELKSFLKTVGKQTPEELDLHVFVDNYSTYKNQKVMYCLKRNIHVTIHFTPTGLSWINLIERSSVLITDTAIQRGVFH